MPLQHIIIVTLFFTLKCSYILGQTLTDTCYCPNSTEFQNPDPIYSNLRSIARKLCRTQQLLSAQIYRIPGKIKNSKSTYESRSCLIFIIYYNTMLNSKEQAEKPILILSPTNPPIQKAEKPLLQHSMSSKLLPHQTSIISVYGVFFINILT